MDLSVAHVLFPYPDLIIDEVQLGQQGLTLRATPQSPTALCPRCQTPSHHLHSHYTRCLKDLPGHQHTVSLHLNVRRFRCRNRQCPQPIFCERLTGLAQPQARTTQPLTEAHRVLGFALGGETGARVAARLATPTSPDTLLRRIKQTEQPARPSPRVVGIDDFAFRKGQIDGTILLDLESG